MLIPLQVQTLGRHLRRATTIGEFLIWFRFFFFKKSWNRPFIQKKKDSQILVDFTLFYQWSPLILILFSFLKKKKKIPTLESYFTGSELIRASSRLFSSEYPERTLASSRFRFGFWFLHFWQLNMIGGAVVSREYSESYAWFIERDSFGLLLLGMLWLQFVPFSRESLI